MRWYLPEPAGIIQLKSYAELSEYQIGLPGCTCCISVEDELCLIVFLCTIKPLIVFPSVYDSERHWVLPDIGASLSQDYESFSVLFFCYILLTLGRPCHTHTHAHVPPPPTNLPALQLKGWLKVMVVATVMAGWAWRKPSQGTSGITSSEWGLRCLQHTPPDPPSSFYLFPATPSLLLVHLGWACVRPHMALWLFISTLFFY